MNDLQIAHNELLNAIEIEGLNYAVIEYHHWKEFKDLDRDLWFLLTCYREAHERLEDYVARLTYSEEEDG